MKNVQKLAISALMVAIAYVLSMIKFIHLPFGGSITFFSMLTISLPSYIFGVRYGFMASITYSLLQMIVDPYIVHPIQAALDYTIAFSCFGIVGFFRNQKRGLALGFIAACIIRFLASSVSGYVFFKEYAPEAWNPLIYTVVYNGSYIFTECVLSIVFISIGHISRMIELFKKKWE